MRNQSTKQKKPTVSKPTQETAAAREGRESETGLLLKKVKPFDLWRIEAPRSARDCELYRFVVNGLKEVDERNSAGAMRDIK